MAILTGINFVAGLLFAPETRYYRGEDEADQSPDTASSSTPSSTEKAEGNEVATDPAGTGQKANAAAPQMPGKTWVQDLSLSVFEPESRLYSCLLLLLITGAGCILFGLFIGYGMISVALTANPAITMANVPNCLLPVNSDASMLVNGLENVVAFGVLYGIVPWDEKVGCVNCFGSQAGIFVAIIGPGMAVFIPFAEKIRHV
ncbi:uncharacterized protein P884DRAFT_289935 [Thermothelomyces heterothallicus CBS 202.75]|uniref:uncharacterized protein n=1 Tax=Thermothelomyces heterothallicus CBS 202.75 TaxID=1149848 RepID=UPI0037430FC5